MNPDIIAGRGIVTRSACKIGVNDINERDAGHRLYRLRASRCIGGVNSLAERPRVPALG